ncbi:MAG TPA: alpha-L-fucosidase [Candidatus Sulfopaludibacter sp.]|nr:alpha-L-fucosidase [Candidatus Sulfopaludibacter sp.]
MMDWTENSRRSFLKQLGAAGALAFSATGASAAGIAPVAGDDTQAPASPIEQKMAATRAERMAWWHQAKFGMFIHWGLYSVIGQHEWAKEVEGVPIPQYELLARHFKPKPNAARDWARLAKRAGQKYMVMTTKHHEGFCQWDSKLTDYCAAKQGPGRDLVREYVEAARAEGLRVGFYYSLMDWHHPDGATCKTDEAARKRFVEYTHGLSRELMTNYGKIDVLWYDVDWPLSAAEWESERMNQMVFDLQPEIIVNNRNGLQGDFSTPEQHIEASEAGRAWETCMTLNDSWGFNRGDDAWKTPKEIVDNLATVARGGGNYLLNIGPEPDGSIPPESVTCLEAVGQWLSTNGKSFYGAERGNFDWNSNANYTRSGNTLYIHQHYWPGHTPAAEWLSFFQPEVVVAIGGLKPRALAARLLKTGQKVEFTQDEFALRLTGLPLAAPDQPATVIEVECDAEPVINHESMRPLWPRYKAGIR